MGADQKNGLKLGTTLYSLTTEFFTREYDFAQLVRKVAADNLGPGLEVVGYQSIRGFPTVTEAFAESFAALIEETKLVPSCLGINADLRLIPDRPMTDDENYDYHVRQIEAAAKLGFPLVRYQYMAGPAVIERLAEVAEKHDVKLGLEIHAPHHPQHPDVLAYREMYARVGSPYLGFIPDFGASARAVPPSFFETQRANGVPAELIALAKEHWAQEGEPYTKQAAYEAEAERRGYSQRHIMSLVLIFGLFSRKDPKIWSEIMDQVIHIHGKFFDFDENGDEIAVDYARALPVFVEGGYDGFMSSEYEGHMWADADGFAKVRAHHALARKILEPLAA